MNAHAPIHDEAEGFGGHSSVAPVVGFEQQVDIAHRYPRDVAQIAAAISAMATIDEETAQDCLYALPRDGKPIKGPSARFAEIVKSLYRNNAVTSRVVKVDRIERIVTAEGVFLDFEGNASTSVEERRSLVGQDGALLAEGDITLAGSALVAIARRNAILAAVPKPIWRGAYMAVQRLIAGDAALLPETRALTLEAFALYGVETDQLLRIMGVKSVEAITLEQIPVLRGMFAALKNGEATVQEMFGRGRRVTPVASGMKARLEALAGDKGGGFSAAQVETETGIANKIPPMKREAVPRTGRKAMTPARRKRVLVAFGCRCSHPGCEETVGLEIDHRVPLELGGSEDDSNLEPLCVEHHKDKTKRDIPAIARARRIRKREAGEKKAGRPIKSRGFDKTKSRRMDGSVGPRRSRQQEITA